MIVREFTPPLADWRSLPEGDERRHAYYASREWAIRRDAVRARSGGVCERCGARAAAAVHHLTYAMLYEEPPEHLWDLCKHCHRFIHNKSDIDPAEFLPGDPGSPEEAGS